MRRNSIVNQGTVSLKLGVITDAQYAAIPADAALDRYYSAAIGRLDEAVAKFNEAGVDAVVNLGDLIDRGFENLAPALACFDRSATAAYHVPGNHDLEVDGGQKAEVLRRLNREGLPAMDKLANGVRLLRLDSTRVSLFGSEAGSSHHLEATGWLSELADLERPNAKSYNGGLGDEQRKWLVRQLKLAADDGERVVIACHQPVFGGSPKFHLWDSLEVIEILAGFPGVVTGWFAGHSHVAESVVHEGVLHWQGAAMVNTAEINAFAIVEIGAEMVVVTGFGRQPTGRWKV